MWIRDDVVGRGSLLINALRCISYLSYYAFGGQDVFLDIVAERGM